MSLLRFLWLFRPGPEVATGSSTGPAPENHSTRRRADEVVAVGADDEPSSAVRIAIR
jgi:hypothetical protein